MRLVPPPTAGGVAVILAVSIGIALNVLTAALLWAAIVRLGNGGAYGLSDNGVQVLLAWGGGIISVIAGYIGYVTGKKVGADAIKLELERPAPEPPIEE